MKSLLLLPLLITLAGCSNIRSKQPVGKEPVDLSQAIGDVELSGIAGEWVDSNGEVSIIEVTNAKEGEIRYASLDEDDDPLMLTLRMTEHHVFVNFPPDDKGERKWLLLKAGGDLNQLLVWEPDTEKFRKLIAEEQIKGTNDPAKITDENGEERMAQNPGAVIDDPDGDWVARMVAGEFGVLFEWTDPIVLRRRVAEIAPIDGDEATQDPE